MVTQSSGLPSQDELRRFTEFPPEIRLRIWKFALDEATAERKIQLAIHSLIYVLDHECLGGERGFCGLHTHCEAHVPGQEHNDGEVTKLSCMGDGHFAVAETLSEPDDEISRRALFCLGIACQEARHVVLGRYPKTLRVFRGEWRPGMESRLVRFNPINDVPIITDLPGFTWMHRHPDLPDNHWDDWVQGGFPQDTKLFQEFREAISSFRCVAFQHSGQRGYLHYAFEAELYQTEAFRNIVLFFESIERLVLWLDPSWWPDPNWKPDTGDDVIQLDNVEDLATAGLRDIPYVVSDARRVLNRFHDDSRAQNSLRTAGGGHWMPRPKPLNKIGCYLAPESNGNESQSQ